MLISSSEPSGGVTVLYTAVNMNIISKSKAKKKYPDIDSQNHFTAKTMMSSRGMVHGVDGIC